jgi:hypothetical protein
MKQILKRLFRAILTIYVMPKNYLLYISGGVNRDKCKVTDSLCENGYYVYAEPLTEAELGGLNQVYSDLANSEKIDTEGQLTGRILMPHKKSQLVSSYIDRFTPVAQNYFNQVNIEVELTLFQKSEVQSDLNNIPGGAFHSDDNKKNLKFFIYLTDVSENNGPFLLSPKTHGFTLRRIFPWCMWEITGLRKYIYVEKLPESAPPVMPVLGSAGTIFCADTTIYHKASPVIQGERRVLVISFAEKRFDPYKYLSSQHKTGLYYN